RSTNAVSDSSSGKPPQVSGGELPHRRRGAMPAKVAREPCAHSWVGIARLPIGRHAQLGAADVHLTVCAYEQVAPRECIDALPVDGVERARVEEQRLGERDDFERFSREEVLTYRMAAAESLRALGNKHTALIR